MLVELGPDRIVNSLNRVEQELGDANALAVGQMRLEEDLGRLESLATEIDYSTIWELHY